MASLGVNSFERLDLPNSFISLREEAFEVPSEREHAFLAGQAETGFPVIRNYPDLPEKLEEYAHRLALVAGYHAKIYSVINSKSDAAYSEIRQFTNGGVELQYSAHKINGRNGAGRVHGPVVWMSQKMITWIVARYSNAHTINKQWFKYQTRKKGEVFLCDIRSWEENSQFSGSIIQMLFSRNLDPLHAIGLPIGSR